VCGAVRCLTLCANSVFRLRRHRNTGLRKVSGTAPGGVGWGLLAGARAALLVKVVLMLQCAPPRHP